MNTNKKMKWDPQIFRDHYERIILASPINFQAENRKFEFYLKSFRLNHSSIVLDAGCGYGRLSKLISNNVKKVIGIDINSENISYAKQYVGERFEGGVVDLSLGVLPFPSQSMDVVVFDNVLMFFDQHTHIALLKESKRILKPGGTIAFNLENANYLFMHVFSFFLLLYKMKAGIQCKTIPHHNKYSMTFYEKTLFSLGFINISSIGDTFYRKMGVGVIELFPIFLHKYILKFDQKYFNTVKKSKMSSFTITACLPFQYK